MKLIPEEKLPTSVFTPLLRKPLAKDCIDRFHDMLDEFVNDGFKPDTARAKAVNHFLPEIRKNLRKRYAELLLNLDKLSDEPLHREIMKTIEYCKDVYGMTLEEAVNLAIKLRKHLIDKNLLPEYDEDDDQDEEDSDDETTDEN